MLGFTFQKRNTALPSGLDISSDRLTMAAASIRNIERGVWKGRHQDESQCDIDGVRLPQDSPTPNLHFICQFHATAGICSRDVRSANSSRVSDHPVSFLIFEYEFGIKLLRTSTFLELDPDVMEGPNIISPGFIDRATRANGSGQGGQSTLSSSRVHDTCAVIFS